jgi:hypothetical protein
MSKGAMRQVYRSINELRGKAGKEAGDKQVLAETAIMNAVKDKMSKQDIHIPSSIPQDVSKLMTENDLQNATIVFSHNAIQLFSYVFGQSMHTAVQQAIQGIEKTVEEVVERKVAQTLNYASGAMGSILGMMQKPHDPYEDFARDLHDANKAGVTNIRAYRKQMADVEQIKMPLDQPEPPVSATKSTRDYSQSVKYGSRKAIVESILRSKYPEQVHLKDIIRIAKEEHNFEIKSVHSALPAIQKTSRHIAYADKKGFYVYVE